MQQVRPRWNMQQQQQMRPGIPNVPGAGGVPRARGVRQVAPRGVGPQGGMPQGVQPGGQRMQNVPMNQPPRMPGGPPVRQQQFKFTHSTRNQPTGPGPIPGEQVQGMHMTVCSNFIDIITILFVCLLVWVCLFGFVCLFVFVCSFLHFVCVCLFVCLFMFL